ncbi:MAG: hypothetical protein IJ145_04840 [Prevotella sp.]|nr:hypothetical protein [Prevotella sp.]
MAENLNNGAEQKDSTRHHHHHHHHRSSADGSSSSHHHHHHSSVRLVKGKRAGRLPWAEGLGMILICLVLFFVIVMCTKLVS